MEIVPILFLESSVLYKTQNTESQVWEYNIEIFKKNS